MLPHVAETDWRFSTFLFVAVFVFVGDFFFVCLFVLLRFLISQIYAKSFTKQIEIFLSYSVMVIYNCKYLFSRQNILLLHFVCVTSKTDVMNIKWLSDNCSKQRSDKVPNRREALVLKVAAV